MRAVRQWIVTLWQSETWLLVAVLAVGALLLVFGLIAGEVLEGEPLAFRPSRSVRPGWPK
jgi:uncharacterized membrane protein YcjF (UPF0283 family)